MDLLAVTFWSCAVVTAYTYAGYPAMLCCMASRFGRPIRRGEFHGRISIIMAVRDGASRVAARRDELIAQLDAAGKPGELIIVSDGSCDGTADRARAGADPRVRVLELHRGVGKAQCLNEAAAVASGGVLVFADVRQRWAPDALARLIENFADPLVGGGSGDLVLEDAQGLIAGVGLYWRYEKALRRMESRLYSTVGVTGAISAARRELFPVIPAGTVLDDVYWPLQIVLQGFRTVHDCRAVAFDRLPERASDELWRKVRTLSGVWQLCGRVPSLLAFWVNPVWPQFVSHKFLRLLVPWALIGMLATSIYLDGIAYRAAMFAQLAAYLIALVGTWRPKASRVEAAASSFLMLNAAAWLSFWVWLSGGAAHSWRKIDYSAARIAAKPIPSSNP